jgi:hypothetical protein
MPHESVGTFGKTTLLALAVALVLYCLSALAIVRWGLPLLDAYYKSHPIDNTARVLVLLSMVWILSPMLPMGAYLCPYGIAIARSGRHPPPGWRSFGSERVIVGRRAKILGVAVCIVGVTTLAGFVVILGYFAYMILIR